MINPKRHLLGVVTLKNLLMNSYETKVADIMDDNILSALTTEDFQIMAGMASSEKSYLKTSVLHWRKTGLSGS